MRVHLGFSALPCLVLLTASLPAFADDLARAEVAFEAGDLVIAESLFTLVKADAGTRHRRELMGARFAASRGDWKGAEARLRAWNASASRREGSGDILFWLGWAALHQGREAEADSLLVLASAYSEEPRAQQALEYRFAALLEHSAALRDFLRGLPESPLPQSLRIASLERVPPESRLYPEARWHLALLLQMKGDTVRTRTELAALAQDASGPGRRAAAWLAFLQEGQAPDSARSAYEKLLLDRQQGVAPEFARKRLKNLDSSP